MTKARKKTARCYDPNGWMNGKEVTCEVTGEWADGTLTWEDENGWYYRLCREHVGNHYEFYFALECVDRSYYEHA